MALLRRVLYIDALLSALSAAVIIPAPGWLLRLLDQPVSDEAWLRLLGIALLSLAALMVLVGHRVEELWWWCWAFVILEAGAAAVATFHVVLGLPGGAEAWPWWLMAGISWAFAGGFLWGIARAGTEASPDGA
jgi:hypothetical protein